MDRVVQTLNLLITHPNMDPELITQRLAITPTLQQKFGSPIVTPKGKKTNSQYNWSKWCYKVELVDSTTSGVELLSLVEKLSESKKFLRDITSDSGEIIVYINISYPESMAMELSLEVMGKLVDMKIKFGFEVFRE